MERNQDRTNIFSQFEKTTNASTVSIYHLLANIGVYASLLGILVACVILIINATSGGERLAGAKKHLIRVLIVSVLIFGASGLVLLVESMGF